MRPTYQRVLGLATLVLLLNGCGDNRTVTSVPAPAQRLHVQLPWRDGGRVPRRYTCDGADKRPAVQVLRPPGTRDVAIVMTDPDAPGGTFVHWTTWGNGQEGRNGFGRLGYGGPCPPRGASPHRYVVTAYALRRPLGLAPGSPPDEVLAAIRNTRFASGSVTALYSRP